MDLSVKIGKLEMKNPVTVASGTFGYGLEYSELIDIERLGAITVKGIKKDPCPGNPLPRFCEVTGGMINAIGLQGPGVEGFVKDVVYSSLEFGEVLADELNAILEKIQ